MSVRHPLSGLLALGLLASACSGSATAPPSAGSSVAGSTGASSAAASASASLSAGTSPSAKATSLASATPLRSPGSGPFTLNSTVWWSGYVITVTGGTYDPVKHALAIDASFQNTSTVQTELSQAASGVKIVWNGQFLPGSVTSGPVPVGATAKGQITLQAPVAFAVDAAVLTFGAPDEHQAIVPLNGQPATSRPAVDLTINDKVSMGDYAALTVNKGVLVPAACSGSPDKIKFGPIKKNEVSVVLWGVATNTDPKVDAYIDQAFLLVPDGTTSASNPPLTISLPSNGTRRNLDGLCFSVPVQVTGSYKLTLHESRSKAFGSITFVIP